MEDDPNLLLSTTVGSHNNKEFKTLSTNYVRLMLKHLDCATWLADTEFS